MLANVVSQEENVKSVVAKVQLGEADAGIVYRSDVTPSVARYVRVFEIPDPYNPIATYPVAVLKSAGNAEAAQQFVALVTSPQGQSVLQRHGLLPAAGAAEPAPATPEGARPGARDRRFAVVAVALGAALVAPAGPAAPQPGPAGLARRAARSAPGAADPAGAQAEPHHQRSPPRPLVVALGLPVAYLLATRDFRGKRALEVLIDLPMVLPPTVAGVALLTAFGRTGLAGRALAALGITLPFTTLGVIVAQAFVAAPFFVDAARAGFAEVDRKYLDAAATLRAAPGTAFFRVLAPLAAPVAAGRRGHELGPRPGRVRRDDHLRRQHARA